MYRVSKAFMEDCAAMSEGLCKENDGGAVRRCIPRGLCSADMPCMPAEHVEKAKKCWARVCPEISKKSKFISDSRISKFKMTKSKMNLISKKNDSLMASDKASKYMVLVSANFALEPVVHAPESGDMMPPGFSKTAAGPFVTRGGLPVYALSQDFLDAVLDFNKK